MANTSNAATVLSATAGDRKAILNWTNVDATSYLVQKGPNWSVIATLGAGVLTYTDQNLANGVQYQYRIRTKYSQGGPEFSNVVTVQPVSATSPAPGSAPVLSGTAASDRNSLSWTAVSGATSYSVKRAVGTGSFVTYASVTALSYVDTAITAGTTYHYRVSAKNAYGEGPLSNTVDLMYSTNPSGVTMPTGNLTGWTHIFADDFNEDVAMGSWPSQVSDKWFSYPYPASTLGGYYKAEAVTTQTGSLLRNYLHNEGGQWLMTAPIPILDGSGTDAGKYQTYGRYAYRWRAEALPGYYMVPLLWPQAGNYLVNGEIDFPEGNLTTNNLYGFVHKTNSTTGVIEQYAYPTNVAAASGWHTSIIEWKPNSVKLIMDGVTVGEATSRTPTVPMRLVLQLTTSPQGLPSSGTAGYVDFDWVSVWAYTP